MTMLFDEREQAFERHFTQEKERGYRARFRRNRLLAAWACERMELPGTLAERYVEGFAECGITVTDEALIERLRADLRAAGLEPDPADLRCAMERCAALARAEQHGSRSVEPAPDPSLLRNPHAIQ